jgi:phage repressor protein C with HTH and peptisase S24 domain
MGRMDAVDVSNSQELLLDVSNVAFASSLLDNSYTVAADAKNPVYRALMALKPDGLAIGRWAEDAGLARNYFHGLEKHGNPRQDKIDRLLAAIGKPRHHYEEALRHAERTAGEFVQSEVAGVASGARDVRTAFFGEERLPKLPVYGSAMGGEFDELEEHVELTELHVSQVIDYIERPASLANDPDAYAVQIVGDSMIPRFKPRELVGVSPRASVVIGDDVVVQLRGPEDDGERVKMVLIKELVRRGSDYVELRQYNPPLTFRVQRARVASMHKVRGNFF